MSAFTYMVVYWSYTALLLACCAYAAARGGAPERWGVAILLVARVATALLPKTEWLSIDFNILLVDTLMFVALVILTLRAQRYWPMWWAAAKLDMLIAHLLSLSPQFMPWSYAAVNTVLSFVSPMVVAVGTWRHRRRLKRYGADPAWTDRGEGSHERRSSDPSDRGPTPRGE